MDVVGLSKPKGPLCLGPQRLGAFPLLVTDPPSLDRAPRVPVVRHTMTATDRGHRRDGVRTMDAYLVFAELGVRRFERRP